MRKATALAIILVGAIGAYHLLMFYDNSFRYGRMRETPAVRPHEEPIPVMHAGVVPLRGGEAVIRATPAAELRSPFAPGDEKAVARGRAVYFTFCAQCHGPDFDGNGTVGQSFVPPPTDLRSAKVQAAHAGELFKSVSYGVPGGRQPALDTTIGVNDRWSVIAFVQSLGARR
jgi:mono/diheme cytochrome c family protein